MTTESETYCSYAVKDTQGKWKSLFYKISLVFILFPLLQIEISAEERLSAGSWKGTFITNDGMSYKLKYIVSYDDKTEDSPVKIKMINMDLEPASEFTYRLSDIKIIDKQIQFKIPMEYETKVCTLYKENNSYFGTCTSTSSVGADTAKITMIPPEEEPSETDQKTDD